MELYKIQYIRGYRTNRLVILLTQCYTYGVKKQKEKGFNMRRYFKCQILSNGKALQERTGEIP